VAKRGRRSEESSVPSVMSQDVSITSSVDVLDDREIRVNPVSTFLEDDLMRLLVPRD